MSMVTQILMGLTQALGFWQQHRRKVETQISFIKFMYLALCLDSVRFIYKTNLDLFKHFATF